MACRLAGAKPVNWTLQNKLQWNLKQNLCILIQENAFEYVVWELILLYKIFKVHGSTQT